MSNESTNPLVRDILDLGSVQGRMNKTRQECLEGTTDAQLLCHFIENEHNYFIVGSSIGVIYMPDPYMLKNGRNEKMIVEMDGVDKMYFEIQLTSKSNFESIIEEYKYYGAHNNEYFYSSIQLDRKQAISFAQLLLFTPLFRQRFLMTTESRVMGSMSTQRLKSSKGQLFALRRCVLNE